MGRSSLLTMNLFFIVLFWGVSLWIYHYRNRPRQISTVLPLIAKHRKHRLHPLFRDKSEVVWIALWMFLLGSLFFVGLLLNFFL